MKSTGIVRKVDELGRIVLPMELRKTLQIEPKDALEIFVENEKIILRKYEDNLIKCSFCEDTKDLVDFKEKKVCTSCLEELHAKTS